MTEAAVSKEAVSPTRSRLLGRILPYGFRLKHVEPAPPAPADPDPVQQPQPQDEEVPRIVATPTPEAPTPEATPAQPAPEAKKAQSKRSKKSKKKRAEIDHWAPAPKVIPRNQRHWSPDRDRDRSSRTANTERFTKRDRGVSRSISPIRSRVRSARQDRSRSPARRTPSPVRRGPRSSKTPITIKEREPRSVTPPRGERTRSPVRRGRDTSRDRAVRRRTRSPSSNRTSRHRDSSSKREPFVRSRTTTGERSPQKAASPPSVKVVVQERQVPRDVKEGWTPCAPRDPPKARGFYRALAKAKRTGRPRSPERRRGRDDKESTKSPSPSPATPPKARRRSESPRARQATPEPQPVEDPFHPRRLSIPGTSEVWELAGPRIDLDADYTILEEPTRSIRDVLGLTLPNLIYRDPAGDIKQFSDHVATLAPPRRFSVCIAGLEGAQALATGTLAKIDQKANMYVTDATETTVSIHRIEGLEGKQVVVVKRRKIKELLVMGQRVVAVQMN